MPKDVRKLDAHLKEIWLGFYRAALTGMSANESISNAVTWAAETADRALEKYLERLAK